MAVQFFTVPIQDDGSAADELNGFLQSHRVLAVERRWVDQGPNSLWMFCVDYLEHSAKKSKGGGASGRSKVDYKDILNPEDFAVFAKLRDLRKQMAQEEAVPVYTIFTNEQLAKMVQTRTTAKADLEKITGVGDARIEKYGARVLDFLKQQWGQVDEASGQVVQPDPGPGESSAGVS